MTTANPAGNPKLANVQITGGPPATKPEAFQKFEDLASKLTKVPKSEVDEKRKTG
jgi:hypothetical protein